MTTFGEEEEHMIDQLFFSCDVEKTGLVEVKCVVDFLKKECNKSKSNEPDLVELANILNTYGGDGFVNIITYRKALKQWISTIRNRSESTSFLETVNEPELVNMTNNSIDLSVCTETSASQDDSVFHHSHDVAELLNDLRFQNRKVCDENAKLQSQLEVQEETVASLSRELQNKIKEEDQMKRKIESLQEQANMGHMLIEENEVLKKKLDKLHVTKRELDMKVNHLEKENALLDQQAWNFENKWQKSTCEMDVLKKDMQELQCSFLEQKDLLNQTQNTKSIIEEKDSKEKELQERLDALLKQNDKLQEEKENAEIRLAQLETKLNRFADVSDTDDSPSVGPELTCSTPGPAPSIGMELKDRLNEDKHLPSPLCEKQEFSRELLFHGRSALLPAYMSAWDLEFSSAYTPDHSLQQLRNDSPLKPTVLDLEKKLASVKKMGKNGLENELVKLYRVNLDLAEKCHKAELRETELQDVAEKHSQTAELEKQKYTQLEESFNHSVLARNVDLKDLWRLVHSPEEEDDSSESDNSLSPSTEILKLQIKQDIEALREKLHKRESILQSLRKSAPTLPYKHKGRASSSPLVDALNIEVVQEPDCQYFECHTGFSIQTECMECDQNSRKHSQSLHHKNNNKSAPLLRRNNKIHNSVPHWNIDHRFNDSLNIMDAEMLHNNNVVAVKNKINAPQNSFKHQFEYQSEQKGTKRMVMNESNGVCLSTQKHVNMDNEKQDNENEKVPSLRRNSYVNAIENEACSLDDVDIPRKRSNSFQTAIEHGQSDLIFIDDDSTPENESLDSVTWKNNAPKFASTPLPVTLKPVVKSVNFYPKVHVFVKEESLESPDEISEISNTLDSECSVSASCNNNYSADRPELDPSTEKTRKSYQNHVYRSSCKELSVLPEEELPCVCCEDGIELEGLTSPTSDINSAQLEDFSPEIWTLSRTGDTSDSSSCRDSGHSSSLTSSCGIGKEEQGLMADVCEQNDREEGDIDSELSRPEAGHDKQQHKDKVLTTDLIQGERPTSSSNIDIFVQSEEDLRQDIQNSDLESKPASREGPSSPLSVKTPFKCEGQVSQNFELELKTSLTEGQNSPVSELKIKPSHVEGLNTKKSELEINDVITEASDITQTAQHVQSDDKTAEKLLKSPELKETPKSFNNKGDDSLDRHKTRSYEHGLVPLVAISPFPSPPLSPCINFFQGREKMKAPKTGQLPEISINEEQNNNETDSPELKMDAPENLDTNNEAKTTSHLTKIRETNLAKRRDQLRPNKMPELSELSEKDSLDDSSKTGKNTDDSTKSDVIKAPEPNGDIVPSIPNEFLKKLGLSAEDIISEELSEQEIESKFASLSLAFKTDAQTLEKRLEIQERSRDIAEQNVDKELQGLRESMSKLNEICTDPQVREVLSKIQNHINILEKASARVSSRAEVFGAIQQEKRLSKAVDIMVHHVENIHRVHEKEHTELEEARKLLQDSRSLGPSALDIAGGDILSRRSASVCPNNVSMGKSYALGSGSLTPATMKAIKLMKPRRRVSEIALPKVLGGSGAPTLHPSPSMDQAFDTRFQRGFVPLHSEYSIDEDEGSMLSTVQNNTTDSVSRIYDKDPRTRFQAVVASTTVKSAIANSLRRTSHEKNNMHHTPPTSSNESPQISRNNSSESGKDSQEIRKNLEEEAYKKGYEQGMRASLGQDLASLREQQNNINESLGDIMDNIDNHMEEPKTLRDVLHERFHGSLPKVHISNWRIRLTMSCFCVVMAVISILLSLFPVNSAEVYSYRNLGYPPL